MKHYTDNYLLNPYHPVTVDIVGAGGTGCQVATAVARIDHALRSLGHIGLDVCIYDDDVVTDANLGRQLFSPSEVGLYKADVLATRFNRFFGTGWDSVKERYPTENTKTSNVVITCTDTTKSRIEIGKWLRGNVNSCRYDQERCMYWMDFGNGAESGQVVLGTLREIKQNNKDGVPYLRCVDEVFNLKEVNDKDSGPSCSLAEALTKQDLFINSTLANLGCNILWKLFSDGGIENHGLFLNLKTMKVNPISINNYEKRKN